MFNVATAALVCLLNCGAGLEVLVALCLLDVRNNLLSSHETLDCLRYLSHLQQVRSFVTLCQLRVSVTKVNPGPS